MVVVSIAAVVLGESVVGAEVVDSSVDVGWLAVATASADDGVAFPADEQAAATRAVAATKVRSLWMRRP